jgi:hypothetical protein
VVTLDRETFVRLVSGRFAFGRPVLQPPDRNTCTRGPLAVEPEIGPNWPRGNRDKSSAMQPAQTSSPAPWSPLSSCLRLRICLGPDGDREAPKPKLGPVSICAIWPWSTLAVVYFGCGLLL